MRRCVRLIVVAVLCVLFTGCAAGKVYMAQSTDDQASCSMLDSELQGAQKKITTLENTDHTLKNLRDLALSAAGFAFPPLGILNAILTVSDSHVADLAETEALKDRSDSMTEISNQKECGNKYAQRH
ncbi:MAG: hypothetical protein H8E42_08975 [Nitrospinae bacterium]|nr:hypothetical protein [Nitrospinota bacterium]MBL7019243.1 hypothetical protein [Nitrospinaceae bacterium]